MRYDTTLKELLRTPPVKLIELLTGAPPVEVLTVEYPSVKMRKTDLVFRQPDGGVHHFELQSENDNAMDYRMLEYLPADLPAVPPSAAADAALRRRRAVEDERAD